MFSIIRKHAKYYKQIHGQEIRLIQESLDGLGNNGALKKNYELVKLNMKIKNEKCLCDCKNNRTSLYLLREAIKFTKQRIRTRENNCAIDSKKNKKHLPIDQKVMKVLEEDISTLEVPYTFEIMNKLKVCICIIIYIYIYI